MIAERTIWLKRDAKFGDYLIYVSEMRPDTLSQAPLITMLDSTWEQLGLKLKKGEGPIKVEIATGRCP